MSDHHRGSAFGDLAINELYRPFLAELPFSGAAVSTLGPLLGSRTLASSNTTAARLDELQFDLGEGPCWDAMNAGRPVLVPDVDSGPVRLWPMFLAAHELRSVRCSPSLSSWARSRSAPSTSTPTTP